MNTYQQTQLDALGDPTRRAILARLLDGPISVGKLADEFPVSRPAISQHLRILKDAKLVIDRPVGNRRLYQLDPTGFDSVRDYIDHFWNQALSAFQKKVEEESMTATMSSLEIPVRKSITVKATPERAFRVFTDEIDTWWPRSHHIGKSPMKQIFVEGRTGGRCYTTQEDGTDCPWGQVLVWEPPHRFVMAWQITHEWGFEPDLARSSEVEVRFTPEADGTTRVDLEHRNFERQGPEAESMRTAVDGEGGWNSLLDLYAQRFGA